MIDLSTLAQDVLDRHAAAFLLYREALPLVPGTYTRTLVEKTDDYEVVAMLWAAGCASPIHDHADSRCWVLVLEGAIEVDNFDRIDSGGARATLQRAERLKLSTGDRDSRLNWRELHQVRNNDTVHAYTLQLYSPVLREYHVFHELNGTMQTVTSIYDAALNSNR